MWLGKNTKTNPLANIERRQLIQSLFPERVKRRIEASDDLDES